MLLSARELYRFERFELDHCRRVLSRDEDPISLTPKAFDVLAYLVLNAGRVVTKDEVLRSVWPDSFVEEGNLAQYISQLRRALGEESCLIATVPGRGYQFAAEVQVEHPVDSFHEQRQGDIYVQRVRERTRVVIEDVRSPASPLALRDTAMLPAGATSGYARVWRWVALSGLLLALAGAYGWRRLAPRPPVSDLVLADFANNTGDPAFDHTLGRALEIDLAQTPFLNLLSRQKVKATLAQMQHKGDETLTPALAAEVCERNNAQAVLNGAIASFGSKYLLTLAADSCVSGKQIAAYKAEANSKEEVLHALDEAAGRVRKQLGESAASLERFQTPIADATTPSLDALRDYSQARERFEHGDWKATQQLLEHAIALDPGFAAAYSSLGAAYSNRGDFSQASKYYKKGFELRNRATARERLQIEIVYHAGFDHDIEEAIRSLIASNRIYPNRESSWGNLSNQYAQLGQFDKAVAAGEEAYRINPHSSYVDVVLAHAYEGAGRFADAQRIADAAIADGKETWEIHSILHQIAFASHETAKIESEGLWGIGHDHAAPALRDLGNAAAARGKLSAATEYFNRAHAEALRAGDTDLADEAMADLVAALIDFAEPNKAAGLLKEINGDPADPGELAILQAGSGDLPAARLFAAQSEARPGRNTVLLYHHLPLVRATQALCDGKPAEAVALLEPARAYQWLDLRVPSLRARAEAEAGMLDASAEDDRQILAHQGVAPLSTAYPLAHLRLARVLALQNKTDDARQQYMAFLDAWKDADAGIPLLRAAKSEFAKLQ